jgi:hypothetical protein
MDATRPQGAEITSVLTLARNLLENLSDHVAKSSAVTSAAGRLGKLGIYSGDPVDELFDAAVRIGYLDPDAAKTAIDRGINRVLDEQAQTRQCRQFIMRPVEMLRSPAYRVLSRAALLMLSCLEVELGKHGGNDNGRLIATYEQLSDYGIGRKEIGPARRELEALGFIEVTERGWAGDANRAPNKFRLTYCGSRAAAHDASHSWRKIDSIEDARVAAKAARNATDERAWCTVRKHKPMLQTFVRVKRGQ